MRREQEVGDGDSAITKIVQNMIRLASRDAKYPPIVALARKLKAGKSDREAARAAFTYVVQNIKYKKDPDGYEFIQAPKYILFERGAAGDCDCMCTALGCLLLVMGYDPLFRVLAHREDAPMDFTHVNAQVKLPNGELIKLDPVMGMPGFGQQKEKVNRQRIWRVRDMKLVTLEDRIPAGALADGGCKCGGKCGKKKRGGCCPQKYENEPVIVNVNTNTGTMTSDSHREFLDARQARETNTIGLPPGAPAIRQVMQRDVVVREVPRNLQVQIPAAQIHQAGYVDPVVPAKKTESKNYKEFY